LRSRSCAPASARNSPATSPPMNGPPPIWRRWAERSRVCARVSSSPISAAGPCANWTCAARPPRRANWPM
jgi:hypothetical protein